MRWITLVPLGARGCSELSKTVEPSILVPSLLLVLCKTSVLISEKGRYYECHCD